MKEEEQKNIEQQEEGAQPVSSLSSSVLQKIEEEKVTQTPRMYFKIAEYSMWALWGLSILIGGVAFSVMIFFSMHAGFALFEATHEGVFDFFLDVMPYAWVGVFVLMAIVAHFNLRHTKCGYRYAVWQVLLSSILLSFALGVLLHMFGVSFLVDSFVAKRMPMLPALQTMEARMWQSPMEGRMIGVYMGEQAGQVTFSDEEGGVWKIQIEELSPKDIELLTSGKRVRVLGMPSTTADSFIGCGVLPWSPDIHKKLSELRQERKEFIESMRQHHEKMLEVLKATGSLPDVLIKHSCGDFPAVMRVQKAGW